MSFHVAAANGFVLGASDSVYRLYLSRAAFYKCSLFSSTCTHGFPSRIDVERGRPPRGTRRRLRLIPTGNKKFTVARGAVFFFTFFPFFFFLSARQRDTRREVSRGGFFLYTVVVCFGLLREFEACNSFVDRPFWQRSWSLGSSSISFG